MDHEILIKINYYGEHGIANDWMSCLHLSSKQFINIDGYVSEVLDTTRIYFRSTIILYFALMIYAMYFFSEIHTFADDTNIFYSCNNLTELCNMLSRELAKLCKWFAVNKLSLNLSKTNGILFGKHSTTRC